MTSKRSQPVQQSLRCAAASISSLELLRRLDVKYWRDFVALVSPESSVFRFVEDALLPVTPNGQTIEVVLGAHGTRTYLQHLAYWLPNRVLVVASSYLDEGKATDECEVRFILLRNGQFQSLSPDQGASMNATRCLLKRKAAA